MAVAAYHRDADALDVVELPVTSASDVMRAVRTALSVRTPIGHPTLEVRREDGSVMSLSTDGHRAMLVRFDADGTSYSSVGGPTRGPVLVFDAGGSWSEAASENTVDLTVAIQALSEFVEKGSVSDGLVEFEAD